MRVWLVVLALGGAATSAAADDAPAPPSAPAACNKAYAEDLSALSAHARDLEARSPAYSYAVRTTATYECVSYATSGELQRAQHKVIGHGTAFGLRAHGDTTLLVTNAHVAEWPAVTDADHAADGVPAGCKRIADALAIVDDDRDDYSGDDIPLERVVVDSALDIAVLRAHAKLAIIPWKLGTSGDLATRELVEVKGFPLGAFRATNIGKVVSAHDHDDFLDWDHDDFVIDALLSPGNSGSPVLALSCKTGEFELVGVYHAAYSRGSALNVVVAIDQLKELIQTLKSPPRPKTELGGVLDGKARVALADVARGPADPPFFPFGGLTGSVRLRGDDTLVFAIYGPEFPRVSRPLIVIEDRPASGATGFGELGAIYLGGAHPLRPYVPDAQARAIVQRALDLARRDAIATFAYRAARDVSVGSRAQADALAQRKRGLDHALAAQAEVTDGVAALAADTILTGDSISLDQIESQTGGARRPARAATPAPAAERAHR